MLVFADRVKETSDTTGTGTLDLEGAETNFVGFVAGIGDTNTCHYAIIDDGNGDWEVGSGVVTDAGTDTLSRDTVFASSNAGALVNFSAGTKDVICTFAAQDVGYPLRYVEGLICEFVSTSTLRVLPGSCRSIEDTENIVLESIVTADITAGNTANGLDENTLTGTTTTVTSSTSVTGSGTAFLTEFGTRTTTGTSSTTTTAATGTGTLYLSEYSVGDLFGNAANGYSRITAIASDTALTLSMAIPGGDLSAVATLCIENAILEADNGEVRRVDEITDNTNLEVTANITTGSVGTALAGSEFADTWYAIWIVKGSSGVASFLSTQRTTLLSPPTGYVDSSRRIGWTRNDDGDDFFEFYQIDDGRTREIRYESTNATGEMQILASGSSTSWAPLDATALVPPGVRTARIHMTMFLPTGTAALYIRARNTGSSSTTRATVTGSEASGRSDNTVRGYLDGAQFVDYRVTADNDAFLDVVGYFDRL